MQQDITSFKNRLFFPRIASIVNMLAVGETEDGPAILFLDGAMCKFVAVQWMASETKVEYYAALCPSEHIVRFIDNEITIFELFAKAAETFMFDLCEPFIPEDDMEVNLHKTEKKSVSKFRFANHFYKDVVNL